MQAQQEEKKENRIQTCEGIIILPNSWPETRSLPVYPGDFSIWASDGPITVNRFPFVKDPILDAPMHRSRGGLRYFNRIVSREAFLAALSNAGINSRKSRYAVFLSEAKDSVTEKCFCQMKVVTNFALCDYYGAIIEEDSDNYSRQAFGIGEAFWRFMTREINACNQGEREACVRIGGNNIKGRLRFGLAVERNVRVAGNRDENSGVYRMWSQPYYPLPLK